MGVDATHYVMIGMQFGFKEFSDEFRESYFEPIEDNGYEPEIPDGLACVSDGMSGKYVMLGRIIAKGIAEHGEGIDVTEITPKMLRDRKLLQAIREIVPDHVADDAKLSVICFTHYH